MMDWMNHIQTRVTADEGNARGRVKGQRIKQVGLNRTLRLTGHMESIDM